MVKRITESQEFELGQRIWVGQNNISQQHIRLHSAQFSHIQESSLLHQDDSLDPQAFAR